MILLALLVRRPWGILEYSDEGHSKTGFVNGSRLYCSSDHPETAGYVPARAKPSVFVSSEGFASLRQRNNDGVESLVQRLATEVKMMVLE
eukprot:6838656-Ditylum_brightwellii.AAC.1